MGDMIAYRSLQHWIFGFNSVQHRALSHRSVELKFHFPIEMGESTQVRRKDNSYHGNVWISTDSTAGRSRTIGFHVSPAFADA